MLATQVGLGQRGDGALVVQVRGHLQVMARLGGVVALALGGIEVLVAQGVGGDAVLGICRLGQPAGGQLLVLLDAPPVQVGRADLHRGIGAAVGVGVLEEAEGLLAQRVGLRRVQALRPDRLQQQGAQARLRRGVTQARGQAVVTEHPGLVVRRPHRAFVVARQRGVGEGSLGTVARDHALEELDGPGDVHRDTAAVQIGLAQLQHGVDVALFGAVGQRRRILRGMRFFRQQAGQRERNGER